MLEGRDLVRRREPGARVVAGRPRWWAVLAVLLALMALVASLTSGSPAASRTGAAAGAIPARHSRRGAGVAVGRPSGQAERHAPSPSGDPATAGAAVPTSVGSRQATSGSGTGDAATATPAPSTYPSSPRPSSEALPATTARAALPTTPAATSTATTVATSTPAASGEPTGSEVGNLTYPDNVSALYSFPGTGPVEATATWSGTPELTLSISCVGRTSTRTGTSGLSVSVPQAVSGTTGTCTVSLTEPTGVRAQVSYSIDVHDSLGGGS